MRTYTFRCQKCASDVEVQHLAHAPHPTRHKGCGGRLKRTFQPLDIVYKGSGFYHTDKRLDIPAE